jgi:hypothetical protein
LASTLDYRPLSALTCCLPATVVTMNIVTSHSLHLGLTLIPDTRTIYIEPPCFCLLSMHGHFTNYLG